MYYVYTLRSTQDKDLYIGSTGDLRRRLNEHNTKQSRSTKSRGPFELVYYEAYIAEEDARRREHSLKLRGQARTQLMRRIAESLRQGQN